MKTHISRTTWRPCESESVRGLCGAAPAVWHECGTTYINLELGAIRILDGGIIALDPLVVHELGCRPCELLQEDGEPALVEKRTAYQLSNSYPRHLKCGERVSQVQIKMRIRETELGWAWTDLRQELPRVAHDCRRKELAKYFLG